MLIEYYLIGRADQSGNGTVYYENRRKNSKIDREEEKKQDFYKLFSFSS